MDLGHSRIHPALQPLRGLLLIHAVNFNIALEELYLFIFREVCDQVVDASLENKGEKRASAKEEAKKIFTFEKAVPFVSEGRKELRGCPSSQMVIVSLKTSSSECSSERD